MTALPVWAATLTNERTRRLLADVLAQLPAHDRAALDALIAAALDEAPAPAGLLAGVGDVDAQLRVRVHLGGIAGIADDAAARWVMAHEAAHVVARHFLVFPLRGLRFFAGAPMDDDEYAVVAAHLEDGADLLAAAAWGFACEHAAFRSAYPGSRAARWEARGA